VNGELIDWPAIGKAQSTFGARQQEQKDLKLEGGSCVYSAEMQSTMFL
jgi:hypothetical protein